MIGHLVIWLFGQLERSRARARRVEIARCRWLNSSKPRKLRTEPIEKLMPDPRLLLGSVSRRRRTDVAKTSDRSFSA